MALPSNYRNPTIAPALFGRRLSVSTAGPSSGGHHKGASSANQTINPFVQGQPGHPAFAAGRFARLAEAQDQTNKPMKAPKAPLMPYMRYSKKMWDHVKAANPRIKSIPDIGKMIGKMWQDLTDEERKEYEMEYELDKAAYLEAMQNYHNSSAYQEWFKKEEMRKLQLAQEAEDKKSISSRVGVVQADEEDDNIFSLKHLASARYSRNHLLMVDIFSDTVVPDVRQAVFSKKLAGLRTQREGLETTLGSRQTEVKTAEEQHEKSRKKILEDRERWEASWQDVCAKKPKLGDDLFEQLVTRARQELREKMRQQQQQQLLHQQQQQQQNQQNQNQQTANNVGKVVAGGGAIDQGVVSSHGLGGQEHAASEHATIENSIRVQVVSVSSNNVGDAGEHDQPQQQTASSTASSLSLVVEESGPKTTTTTTTITTVSTMENLDKSQQPATTVPAVPVPHPSVVAAGFEAASHPPSSIETTDDDFPIDSVPATSSEVGTGQSGPSAAGQQPDDGDSGDDNDEGEEAEADDILVDDDEMMMEGDEGEEGLDLASSASSLPVLVDQRQVPSTHSMAASTTTGTNVEQQQQEIMDNGKA